MIVLNNEAKRYILKGYLSIFLIILLVIPYYSFYFWFRGVSYDQSDENINKIAREHATVAIVFGAGTLGNYPNSILRERLDTAGKLYQGKGVETILVSGSNIEGHNEIEVMRDYLLRNYEIAPEDILEDGYGLRSYDTCIRAKEAYKIDNAILVSTTYHLPRIQFLCEKHGINQIGVSDKTDRPRQELYYLFREYLASYKALLDIYLLDPEYIDSAWVKETE